MKCIRGRDLLKTGQKYYASDMGLRRHVLGGAFRDYGRVLENLVYLELVRRFAHVRVGTLGSLEVDFVSGDEGSRAYWQVAASVRDEVTLERELRPLRELRDKYMGISSALHKMHAGDALKGLRRAVNIRSLDKLLWMYDDESLIEADLLTYWDRYAGLISGGEPETRHAAREGPPGTIEEKAMLHDLLSYLPDDILTKVDRASMSVSLECRAPLLDHRIVAFALSLPLQYKYHDGVQKRILKDLLFREVPRELIGREKRGFAVPVEKWMREDLDGIRERFFRKEYIEKQGIFSYSVIRRILVGFESGRNPNYAKELWTLYAFQLWHARYLGDPC